MGKGETTDPLPNGPIVAEDAETFDLIYGKFSPDGARIATYLDDLSADARVGIVSDRKVRMFTPPELDVNDFAWMPDSKSVIVAYHPAGNAPDMHPVADKFAIFGVDGTLIREIATDLNMQAEQSGMEVSPNGEQALMAVAPPDPEAISTDIVEVTLSTGRARRITNTKDICETRPNYAADGQVIFAATPCEDGGATKEWISAVSVRTGAQRRFTDSDKIASDPTVSQNGHHFVYSVLSSGSEIGGRELWAMSVADGNPERVLSFEGVHPDLHPSGRRVLLLEVGLPGEPGPLRVFEIAPSFAE